MIISKDFEHITEDLVKEFLRMNKPTVSYRSFYITSGGNEPVAKVHIEAVEDQFYHRILYNVSDVESFRRENRINQILN